VHLLDYDDPRGDEDLAEHVGGTGELPQLTVEAGLAHAVAEYRALASHQAQLRRTSEAGR
jgi:hypothetical protein